ncbi:MAG: sugar transferase [Terriglobia bacterium]
MGTSYPDNKLSTPKRVSDFAYLPLDGAREIVPERAFTRLLCLERKRAERSQKQFLLMLLDIGELLLEGNGQSDVIISKILHVLLSSTRETDISGWYESRFVLGTILTEIHAGNLTWTVNAILAKVNTALLQFLTLGQINKIRFTFHLFPEESGAQTPSSMPADLKLYPDLLERGTSEKSSRVVKRSIDFIASLALLALLSPLMAGIAAAIKLTSKGPILFRQKRLGQYGRAFTFLKFRSMYVNNDSKIHQEYVKQFISGTADRHPSEGNGASVYKLTKDPRVTRVGRFLRKTSLDELPQLINVLWSQMSLVGPRPPIPYEIASYEAWHRRRLLEAKPGITGLWQVSGRSKTKFDEMVRLDLRYANAWSLALDFKILLQTPRAVLLGEGAH